MSSSYRASRPPTVAVHREMAKGVDEIDAAMQVVVSRLKIQMIIINYHVPLHLAESVFSVIF